MILNPEDIVTVGKEKHKILATAAIDTELLPSKPKGEQKNRHLKVECANPACPGKHGRYYVRITERRYKDDGVPMCPVDGYPLLPEGDEGGPDIDAQIAAAGPSN